MGSIRKQTIISSLLVYVGFIFGFVNIYFYTAKAPFGFYNSGNIFSPEQYALTRLFFYFSQIMLAFGTMGVIPVIYKFFPYYKDNLEPNKNDLMTGSLAISLIGFLLVLGTGLSFQHLIVREFSERSILIVDYYFWIFPFAAGMIFFSILEAFCWAIHKTVISNFLKETGMRIVTSFLIIVFYFKLISFSTFIYLFSFLYILIFFVLLVYLLRTGELHFTFSISRVTKKFWKKMVGMQVLIFGGTCISALAESIDSMIIASVKGLGTAGVFFFAQYAANLIQVPQRSIQAISSGVLSREWKDKNYIEISRIYERSCINLLIISLFIFGNLWLNAEHLIKLLKIQDIYSAGLGVIFILGIVRIVDAGTGLNAMVIGTSTFWRFDFYSGVVLLAFRLPLTYFLIVKYGIIGSAFAELIAYTVYNFIRFEFLRRRFNMQPFSKKTVYSIILAIVSYGICYFTFIQMAGWLGLFLRAILFSLLMILGVFYGNLTPDASQLLHNVKKRFKV